ncbi:hypothetical protein HDV00_003671 [Rhizophlyctis rosea]|nr:hypothetical protein HDV00_003671 [Rhizophlyctis rosea]
MLATQKYRLPGARKDKPPIVPFYSNDYRRLQNVPANIMSAYRLGVLLDKIGEPSEDQEMTKVETSCLEKLRADVESTWAIQIDNLPADCTSSELLAILTPVPEDNDEALDGVQVASEDGLGNDMDNDSGQKTTQGNFEDHTPPTTPEDGENVPSSNAEFSTKASPGIPRLPKTLKESSDAVTNTVKVEGMYKGEEGLEEWFEGKDDDQLKGVAKVSTEELAHYEKIRQTQRCHWVLHPTDHNQPGFSTCIVDMPTPSETTSCLFKGDEKTIEFKGVDVKLKRVHWKDVADAFPLFEENSDVAITEDTAAMIESYVEGYMNKNHYDFRIFQFLVSLMTALPHQEGTPQAIMCGRIAKPIAEDESKQLLMDEDQHERIFNEFGLPLIDLWTGDHNWQAWVKADDMEDFRKGRKASATITGPVAWSWPRPAGFKKEGELLPYETVVKPGEEERRTPRKGHKANASRDESQLLSTPDGKATSGTTPPRRDGKLGTPIGSKLSSPSTGSDLDPGVAPFEPSRTRTPDQERYLPPHARTASEAEADIKTTLGIETDANTGDNRTEDSVWSHPPGRLADSTQWLNTTEEHETGASQYLTAKSNSINTTSKISTYTPKQSVLLYNSTVEGAGKLFMRMVRSGADYVSMINSFKNEGRGIDTPYIIACFATQRKAKKACDCGRFPDGISVLHPPAWDQGAFRSAEPPGPVRRCFRTTFKRLSFSWIRSLMQARFRGHGLKTIRRKPKNLDSVKPKPLLPSEWEDECWLEFFTLLDAMQAVQWLTRYTNAEITYSDGSAEGKFVFSASPEDSMRYNTLSTTYRFHASNLLYLTHIDLRGEAHQVIGELLSWEEVVHVSYVRVEGNHHRSLLVACKDSDSAERSIGHARRVFGQDVRATQVSEEHVVPYHSYFEELAEATPYLQISIDREMASDLDVREFAATVLSGFGKVFEVLPVEEEGCCRLLVRQGGVKVAVAAAQVLRGRTNAGVRYLRKDEEGELRVVESVGVEQMPGVLVVAGGERRGDVGEVKARDDVVEVKGRKDVVEVKDQKLQISVKSHAVQADAREQEVSTSIKEEVQASVVIQKIQKSTETAEMEGQTKLATEKIAAAAAEPPSTSPAPAVTTAEAGHPAVAKPASVSPAPATPAETTQGAPTEPSSTSPAPATTSETTQQTTTTSSFGTLEEFPPLFPPPPASAQEEKKAKKKKNNKKKREHSSLPEKQLLRTSSLESRSISASPAPDSPTSRTSEAATEESVGGGFVPRRLRMGRYDEGEQDGGVEEGNAGRSEQGADDQGPYVGWEEAGVERNTIEREQSGEGCQGVRQALQGTPDQGPYVGWDDAGVRQNTIELKQSGEGVEGGAGRSEPGAADQEQFLRGGDEGVTKDSEESTIGQEQSAAGDEEGGVEGLQLGGDEEGGIDQEHDPEQQLEMPPFWADSIVPKPPTSPSYGLGSDASFTPLTQSMHGGSPTPVTPSPYARPSGFGGDKDVHASTPHRRNPGYSEQDVRSATQHRGGISDRHPRDSAFPREPKQVYYTQGFLQQGSGSGGRSNRDGYGGGYGNKYGGSGNKGRDGSFVYQGRQPNFSPKSSGSGLRSPRHSRFGSPSPWEKYSFDDLRQNPHGAPQDSMSDHSAAAIEVPHGDTTPTPPAAAIEAPRIDTTPIPQQQPRMLFDPYASQPQSSPAPRYSPAPYQTSPAPGSHQSGGMSSQQYPPSYHTPSPATRQAHNAFQAYDGGRNPNQRYGSYQRTQGPPPLTMTDYVDAAFAKSRNVKKNKRGNQKRSNSGSVGGDGRSASGGSEQEGEGVSGGGGVGGVDGAGGMAGEVRPASAGSAGNATPPQWFGRRKHQGQGGRRDGGGGGVYQPPI